MNRTATSGPASSSVGAYSLGYANGFQELAVYKKTRGLSREIFQATHKFPREEMFALTDQLRRASRSGGAQIAEAWASRRYPRHFVSKLTDADGEQLEMQHGLTEACDCGYLTREGTHRLGELCLEVGRMLGEMISKSSQFCQRNENELHEKQTFYGKKCPPTFSPNNAHESVISNPWLVTTDLLTY